ncbi:hypothetical protein ACFQBS_24645 [Planomonospora parontospora]|uniref:hypothetical protein n=1 Tax=Planomonospora parontospora TaxID=58119 RepID=UPI003614BED8
MQVKKIATYAAVAFVAFYLFSRPAEAAAAVSGVFDGIIEGPTGWPCSSRTY